jgi:peptidoglycan/xylan/chitin deacetylase (PgdA/CDA1 family)
MRQIGHVSYITSAKQSSVLPLDSHKIRCAYATVTMAVIAFGAFIPSFVMAGTLTARPAYALNNNLACNCVIFRFDDIQDYWIAPVQKAVMDKFLEKNQKVSLGIIMNYIGKDVNIMSKVDEGASRGLFELDLHGWNHVDYSTLSPQDQENTLFSAHDKLETLFGVNSPVFITPYNKFNNSTLNAMENIQLKVISAEQDNDPYPWYKADGSGSDIKDSFGIYHLPETTTYAEHPPSSIVYIPESQIIAEVNSNIATYGYAVITIHPQDFAIMNGGVYTSQPDPQRIAELDRLIDAVLAQDHTIKNFQDLVGFTQQQALDKVPPTVIAPADIVIVSSGTLTNVTLGNPTVTDNADPQPTVTNNAPAGGFPLGTTVVTYEADDASGNSAYATQFVTIVQSTDAKVPKVATFLPLAGTVFSGPTSGVTINLSGMSMDYEILGGTQTNSLSPSTSSAAKTSSLSAVTFTTAGAVNGTLILRQAITLEAATTISAGTPVKTTTADAGLTLGTITASVAPGTGSSSTTHLLTLNIPFATTGQVTAKKIGVISTPLTLGSAQTSTVATGIGSPDLRINSGNAGGSGVKTVEVRVIPAGASSGDPYKQASPGGEHDWSTWTYSVLVKPSNLDVNHQTTLIARATDYFGNQAWYTIPITVNLSGTVDTSAPTMLPPPPRTVEASGPLTNVTLGFPTVSDNVTPTGSIVVTNNAPSAGFPIGVTTVTWTAKDAALNTATVTQKVTVKDTSKPTIKASNDILTGSTGPKTLVPLGSPVVSDLADPSPIMTNNAPTDGFPLGTTNVTWTATDHSGNIATDVQKVIIANDNQPPSITAPADISVQATGSITVIPLGEPTVSDNVDPNPIVTNNAPSGNEGTGFPIGTTIVTWTAMDHFGNLASADQIVNVLETIPPTFVEPPDKTVLSRGTLTPVYLTPPIVTDNADSHPTIVNNVTSSPDHIAMLPIGTKVVHWTATDASGNSASIDQEITVSDKAVVMTFDDEFKSQFTTAKPILDQYGFKATYFIITSRVGQGPGVMTWDDIRLLNATGDDIESHTVNHLHMNTLSLADLIYEVKQSGIELNNHGYDARIFTYPFNEGEQNKTLVGEIAKNYDLGRLGVANTMLLECNAWDISITNQTDCRTYDESGNVNYGTRYTIKAWTHNALDMAIQDQNEIYQLFVNEVNSPTHNVNGKIVEIPVLEYHSIDTAHTESSTNPTLFANEMQYLHDNDFVVLTMDDLAYNSTSNTLYIKQEPLHDSEAPFIQAPADVGIAKTGILTQVSLGQPVVGDNRDRPLDIEVTNNAPAAGFPVGMTTVTWTAMDSSGNTATATQRVYVLNSADTIDASVAITTPTSGANIVGTPKAVKVTVQGTASDAQSQVAKVEVRSDLPADISYILATPNAPGDWSTWSVNLYFRTQGPETLVARVIDVFGNVDTVSMPINVTFAVDTLPPSITAPPNVTVMATGALTSVSLGTPAVIDDTDPAPTVTSNAPAGGFSPGTTTVTWTARDASNNIATATQNVTVTDTGLPTVAITSPANNAVIVGPTGNVDVNLAGTASDSSSGIQKVEVKSGAAGAVFQMATPGSPGNWTTWSAVLNFATPGPQTIIAKATDNAGNTQQFTIAVSISFTSDATKPTISISSPLNNAVMTGPASGVAISITGSASDFGSGLNAVELKLGAGAYKSVTPMTPGDWSSWSSQLTIKSSGTYTIIARATDNARNQQWAILTITVNLGVGP